jgi:hypothetical protein
VKSKSIDVNHAHLLRCESILKIFICKVNARIQKKDN